MSPGSSFNDKFCALDLIMYLQCQGGKESNFFIVVPGKRFIFGKIYDDKRVRKLTSLIVIFYVFIYNISILALQKQEILSFKQTYIII